MTNPDEHDLTMEELSRAREAVPIACVDALPWRQVDGGRIEACLIKRSDRPGQWNLVGGRIRRCESIDAAVTRHMHSTLGSGVTWIRTDFSSAETVGQYFPVRTDGHGHDPRQHSVAFTYALEIAGDPHAAGEAAACRWFDLEELPARNQIGYDQANVIHAVRAALLDRKLSTVRRSPSSKGIRASKPIRSLARETSR